MLEKASKRTWLQIKQSGGRPGGGKTGLGYTPLPNPPLPAPAFMKPDETLAEMRISQKGRVFGVRRERTFYIFQLDKNHDVYG